MQISDLLECKAVGYDDNYIWLDNGKHITRTEFLALYNLLIDYLAGTAEDICRQMRPNNG